MKLIKLTMTAFGPYRQKQEIDFQTVSETGIYLITGDTGSGKTSIFDAISFALYGRVSGERKSSKTLKCDLASLSEYCSVMLSFSMNGEEYTIQRMPDQLKKKRGGGVTNFSHRAELILPNGKRVTKLSDIQSMIEDEIIGIDLANFEKLVMLPQGEFQKLLSEQGGDRTKTLRKIFGTEIYSLLTQKMFDKARELERKSDVILERCKQIILAVDGLDEDIKDAVRQEQAEYSLALRKLKELNRQRMEHKKELHVQLTQFLQEQKQVEQELLLSRRSLEIQKILDALRDEKSFLQKKGLQFERMKKYISKCSGIEQAIQYESATRDSIGEKKSLERKYESMVDKISENERLLSNLLTEIGQEDQLQTEIKNAEEQLFYCEKLISYFRDQQSIQNRIHFIERDLNRYQQMREYVSIKEEIARLEEQIKQQKTYLELQMQLKIAKREMTHAKEDYNASWKLFLKGQAGVLASGLEEGKPCPVCGAVHHIQYAFRLPNTPSEEEISHLKEEYDGKLNAYLNLQKLAGQLGEKESINEMTDDAKDWIMKKEVLIQKADSLCASIAKRPICDNLDDRILALQNERISLRTKEEMICKEIEALSQRLVDEVTSDSIEKHYQRIKNRLQALCKKQNAMQDRRKVLEGDIQLCRGHLLQITQSIQLAEKRFSDNKEKFSTCLSSIEMGYKEFLYAKEQLPLIKKMKAEMETDQKRLESLLMQETLLQQELKGYKHSMSVNMLEKKKQALHQKEESLHNQLNRLTEQLAIEHQKEQELETLLCKHTFMLDEYGSIKQMSVVSRGGKKRMSFEKYVLASYFDDVIAFANLRLERMSQYRYRLSRIEDLDSDGLDLEVFDCYTGKARHISTLSGGETFAASLALSLGLSDMISHNAGGISLDSIMIDEGFGALDPTYLNNVVVSLRQMENAGCQIGIISHVADLKQLIPAQIRVKSGDIGEGSSIECFS